MMFFRMIEREQPDQKTRLFVSNQHGQQILFCLVLRANVPCSKSLPNGVQVRLHVCEDMCLGLDLQSIASERPLWRLSEPRQSGR
jgi:hypothetical protein